MNYNHITQAYQNAERQALEEMNDPHLIVLTMFDALLKSMQLFQANIDIRNGGDSEVKSKHFARALSIIYALQSSLDFEKGENGVKKGKNLSPFSHKKRTKTLIGSKHHLS